jgi:hypothetical protein
MQANVPCQKVLSMDTDHSPFFSAPEALVAHLTVARKWISLQRSRPFPSAQISFIADGFNETNSWDYTAYGCLS